MTQQTETTPAYESEELGLTETERIEAKHAAQVAGQPPMTRIIDAIKRDGQDPALLEAALGLPLEQYRKVEAAFKAQPRPRRMRAPR